MTASRSLKTYVKSNNKIDDLYMPGILCKQNRVACSDN